MSRVLVILSISFFSGIVQAQPEQSEEKNKLQQRYDFGAHAGVFLPNEIFGVRDQYPFWGFRFGHPLRIWRLEYGAYIGNAKGVRYYNASLSVALEAAFEDITFIPFFGADWHYYSGRTNIRTLPFASVYGGHVGFSPFVQLGPDTAARVDFKYSFSPGNSLYVGVGLVFFWFGGGDSEAQN